ncbi:MAG: SUMF1/EgtB/PvdO family nonheme iron enzyme [Fibrobacterales bacterium]
MTTASSKKRSKKRILIPLLILLILLLLIFWQYKLAQMKGEAEARSAAEASLLAKEKLLAELEEQKTLLDSIAFLRKQDSILRQQIAEEEARQLQDSVLKAQNAQNKANAAKKARRAIQRSLKKKSIVTATIAPKIQVSPPTGRYYEPISIKARCSESKCSVMYSTTEQYSSFNTPLSIETNSTLTFFAIDSAGNHSDTITRSYEFKQKIPPCPNNMSPVPLKDGTSICMDLYEWPNTLNETPKVFVSHKEASALCSSLSKRLCSKEEWQTSCSGKLNTDYPYGSDYNPAQCVTTETKSKRSGHAKDCRSYYGHYDMSGNIWEWTSTPHEQRASFYYVSGGNYSSKDASTCQEAKYSFYPQNQYQFVGFRCCK